MEQIETDSVPLGTSHILSHIPPRRCGGLCFKRPCASRRDTPHERALVVIRDNCLSWQGEVAAEQLRHVVSGGTCDVTRRLLWWLSLFSVVLAAASTQHRVPTAADRGRFPFLRFCARRAPQPRHAHCPRILRAGRGARSRTSRVSRLGSLSSSCRRRSSVVWLGLLQKS